MATTLRVGMEVHVTRRPVLEVGQLPLRAVIVDLVRPGNVGKLDALATGQAADRVGTARVGLGAEERVGKEPAEDGPDDREACFGGTSQRRNQQLCWINYSQEIMAR